jgi:hypothetical protein
MTRTQKVFLSFIALFVFGWFGARLTVATKLARRDLAANLFSQTGFQFGDDENLPASSPHVGDARAPAKTLEFAVVGATTVYPIRSPELLNQLANLKKQFAGKANIEFDERTSTLMVHAPADVQAAIHEVISFVTRQWPTPATAGTNSAQTTPLQNPEFQWVEVVIKSYREQIDAAMNKIREARSDMEKQVARYALREVLAQVFAADMEAREKQAKEIETRLAKLRQQYQAREKIKDEIIGLQLQVLEKDAAGLGFPDAKPRLTAPDKSLRSPGDSSRNPDIMWRSPNTPASGVRPPGPTTKDRPLAKLKKEQSAVIGELNKLGHFAETSDGKLYAHVSSNHPHGPSIIRVVDSLTGELVATATINSVVGPIHFTEEGVASREADGSVQLRVPLTRRDSNDGDVREPQP